MLQETFRQTKGGLYDSIPTERDITESIISEEYYREVIDRAGDRGHGEYIDNLDLARWYVETTRCTVLTALDEIYKLEI